MARKPSEVLKRQNLDRCGQVAFLLLGLDEPGHHGACLMHIEGGRIDISITGQLLRSCVTIERTYASHTTILG